ncbi:unnamed protein product [Cylindrotheca closterium]|uniref:Fe2OG dioxygenase domain-containing protein n=1 Tax=Cylindrotheca closterium TaxID=2856 RepID=A0AAD2FBF9_9STRA|nr:unnamed protein product [Cylindrotheca closterium]
MVNPDFLIPLETPCVFYDEDFLPKGDADGYYAKLLKEIKWEKSAKINRWVSLHHNLTGEEDYKYRDAPGAAQQGFHETVDHIRKLAEDWYEKEAGRRVEFNVCLLNYYENGQQRIGWHSDREEVGRSTPIASISLGTPRHFLIRSKVNGVQDRASLDLANGSLVIMENACQMEYLHSVPKQTEIETGRINLTFRCKEEGDLTLGEEAHELRDNCIMNLTDGMAADASGWSPVSDATKSVFGDNVRSTELDPDYPEIYFLVSTNLGAERYCAAEMTEVLDSAGLLMDMWSIVAAPMGLDGLVACSSKEKEPDTDLIRQITSLFLNLRSAQHVLNYHSHFGLEEIGEDPAKVDGETLYQYYKKQLVEGKMSVPPLEKLGKGTFRVTCERIGGPHAFQSSQVQFEMGGAMVEYYSKIKPKMEDYDVCVYVFVIGYQVVVATQLNVNDLSKERHFLQFRNAVTIKTNLAYAMVRLADITAGDRIADPFCGSGTLILEALEVYHKKLFCVGMDVSRRSANGAKQNAVAENCGDDVCKFVCCDARGLRKHLEDDSVDAIISNLPWGIMTGHKDVSDLKTMYEIFLRTAWYVLKPGGRIVMLVLRGLQITRIVRKLSGRFRLLSVNVVRTTNNLPCIVVVEKLKEDEIRDSIKGQLAHFNQYINVSPEIYHAIHNEDIDEQI